MGFKGHIALKWIEIHYWQHFFCFPDDFKNTNRAKYSKAAQKKVEKVMHEKKKGTLHSGSGKKVTSRKQAIAIGLSEVRKGGSQSPKEENYHKETCSKKVWLII